MITTKVEYNKRKHEVSRYLDAVGYLDKGECKIVCTDILGNDSSLSIDDELSKILKANCFILLYNLIESTIVNSIKAITNSIESEKLTFEQFSDEIKRLWIRQEAKTIKDISQTVNIITKLTDSILKKEFIAITVDSVHISGNIDAQEIRKIAKQIGWEQTKDGRDLATVKNKRNSLAHGEFTFSDIGKDYTIRELIEIKNKTLQYLDDVLQKVEEYVNSKKYKK